MRSTSHILLCGASALSLTCLLSGPAFAQASDGSAPADEVVVTGVRASLRDSIQIKRSSDLISDVISTKDIGQLPDVTIAEELNRLPGVNTTRDPRQCQPGLGPRPRSPLRVRPGQRPRGRFFRAIAGRALGSLSL